MACSQGRLADVEVTFSRKSACCVVMASGGYPGSYETGYEISFGDTGDALVYHAGTKESEGRILTSGGRVLGVTATGESLEEAIGSAYDAVNQISFASAFYRRDIGQKARNC